MAIRPVRPKVETATPIRVRPMATTGRTHVGVDWPLLFPVDYSVGSQDWRVDEAGDSTWF